MARPRGKASGFIGNEEYTMQQHNVNLLHMNRRICEQRTSRIERKKNKQDPELYPTYIFRTDTELLRMAEVRARRGAFANRGSLAPTTYNIDDFQLAVSTISTDSQNNSKSPRLPTSTDVFRFKKFCLDYIVKHQLFTISEISNFFSDAIRAHSHLNSSSLKKVVEDLCIELEIFRPISRDERLERTLGSSQNYSHEEPLTEEETETQAQKNNVDVQVNESRSFTNPQEPHIDEITHLQSSVNEKDSSNPPSAGDALSFLEEDIFEEINEEPSGDEKESSNVHSDGDDALLFLEEDIFEEINE